MEILVPIVAIVFALSIPIVAIITEYLKRRLVARAWCWSRSDNILAYLRHLVFHGLVLAGGLVRLFVGLALILWAKYAMKQKESS